MTSSPVDTSVASSPRWSAAWHLLSIGNVAVSTAIAVASGVPGKVPMLVLGAAMIGATWFFVLRPRAVWGEAPWRSTGYILTMTGLAIGASQLHPIYLGVAGGVGGQVFVLLPARWAIPQVVLLGGLMVLRMWELGSATGMVLVALSWVIGTFLALFITAISRQSQERARLIEQLEQTRRELAAAEREAGTLAERQRVSRELHDTLTQDLVCIVRSLESASREADPDAARAALARAATSAREGLTRSRSLVTSLRPDLLEGEEASLARALGATVDRFRAQTGLQAELSVPDDAGAPLALPLPVEVALLRVAQEALANVAKHARAKAVLVTLTRLDDVVALDVNDDGVGFDPAAPVVTGNDGTSGGFGLVSLRERIAGVGGVVAIESTPGEGTTIAVQVPLAPAGST